ncbi:hypothetical protein MCHI_001292 [Candidatus Magnetoovum chiemensis]|nr:hypothetical protein MCHI_001292 [Candidatus Magnetoovum chiemensis]
MKEVTNMVVNLMAAAARTAPKAGGKDFIEIVVITDEDKLKSIAHKMKQYATIQCLSLLLDSAFRRNDIKTVRSRIAAFENI